MPEDAVPLLPGSRSWNPGAVGPRRVLPKGPQGNRKPPFLPLQTLALSFPISKPQFHLPEQESPMRIWVGVAGAQHCSSLWFLDVFLDPPHSLSLLCSQMTSNAWEGMWSRWLPALAILGAFQRPGW